MVGSVSTTPNSNRHAAGPLSRRDGTVIAERHSLQAIHTAVEALMARLSGGKSYDHALAGTIAGNLHRDVNGLDSGLETLDGPAFERLVTEKAPKILEASNDPATKMAAAKAEAARANIAGAPLSEAARIALGFGRYAHGKEDGGGTSGEGGKGRSGERLSASAFNRDAPLTATGAVSYAREIGANPALAGFFVGGSPEMRDALRNAINNGAAITDDKVKNMRDVSMVLGAIRAGKLKPDDPRIPLSVREVIDEMKAKGVDTSDPKAVEKYTKEHPEALAAAKKKIEAKTKENAGLTPEQLKAKILAKDDGSKPAAVETKPPTAKPDAKGKAAPKPEVHRLM